MRVSLSYTEPQENYFFSPENEGKKFILLTKGRRFGATKGAANAMIEWCLAGDKCLWGDTVHANIDRYVDRYFKPELKANKIEYEWSKQAKTMKFESGGVIDFRSADNPENWEGFGYNKIFLNEAGIILKNKYLYTNAVLPMLMDFPDSQLFAAGVPKGKFLKNGEKHPFFSMWEQAGRNPLYRGLQYSSYDNPLLRTADIDALAEEIGRMSAQMKLQEIFGEFVELVQNAVFSEMDIENNRVADCPEHTKIVVAVDPATTSNKDSDETGIVVVGVDAKKHGYVLEDASGVYSPNEWASKAISLYEKYKANEIVAEVNQGGEMVKDVIQIRNRAVKIATVHAAKGKIARAEPVGALYEQGLIHHVGNFQKLEFQMTTFDGQNSKSPDRMDALVWGFHRILIKSKDFIAV